MLNAILATVIVSLISMIGALLFFRKHWITGQYGGVMISLAAGVMLATAALDLLPDALEGGAGRGVYMALLAGVCSFFILERLIHWYHHHGHEHSNNEIQPPAYLILISDSLHNLFDGVAVATAFHVNVELGVITTVAIVLHEIPHELANFVALVHNGLRIGQALLYNFISALPAILGTVLGWYFLEMVSGASPYLLAFNAGMFIYISCSDLIPSLHENFKKDRKWLQTFTFLLGVLLMAFLMQVLQENGGGKAAVELKSPVVGTHLEAGK